jgi:hypothetical protein
MNLSAKYPVKSVSQKPKFSQGPLQRGPSPDKSSDDFWGLFNKNKLIIIKLSI